MKVILLVDVPKVGRKYEIKEVADGFGRNVLLPQKKAIIATSGEVAKIEKLKADKMAGKLQKANELKKLVGTLNEQGLIISAKANNEGQLFAALRLKDIVVAVKEQAKITLDEKNLQLEEPIKMIGSHILKIKTSPSLGGSDSFSGEVKLTVTKL